MKYLLIVLLLISSSAYAEQPQFLDGVCSDDSHTAAGKIGDDLTKLQTPFKCNGAVISFLSADRSHVMVSFSEKKSNDQNPISFAGMLEPDGQNMSVRSLYTQPDKPTPIKQGDGACKFFFKSGDMDSIFCGAKVDADGHRSTAIITFNVQNLSNAAAPADPDDEFTNNAYLEPLQTCFAKNHMTLSEEEADAMAKENDYSFLNPPSICQKKINMFVDACVKNGHAKDKCQGAYAVLWIKMNSPHQ